jgi:hypothetical protein
VGDRAAHLEQAESNWHFADTLLAQVRVQHNQAFIDWAVTAAFYSTLHYVEAVLADHQLHPRHHWERTAQLSEVGADSDMCLAYERLRDWSEQARYYMRHFDLVIVERTVLTHYLTRVATTARR